MKLFSKAEFPKLWLVKVFAKTQKRKTTGMEALISEDSINRHVVPYLSTGKREGRFRVSKGSIVAALLYRLETGCRWRQLPTMAFFAGYALSWQGVYCHFRRWVGDGSPRRVWLELLRRHRRLPDLSCVQLGGSQTLCKNGGGTWVTRAGKRPQLQQPVSGGQQGSDAGLQPPPGGAAP
jgi:transposase